LGKIAQKTRVNCFVFGKDLRVSAQLRLPRAGSGDIQAAAVRLL